MDNRTTATTILRESIRNYTKARDIFTWEGGWIEVAEPGSEAWSTWQRDGTHMHGDPAASEIALRGEGYGRFYGCVEAAIADLRQYLNEAW